MVQALSAISIHGLPFSSTRYRPVGPTFIGKVNWLDVDARVGRGFRAAVSSQKENAESAKIPRRVSKRLGDIRQYKWITSGAGLPSNLYRIHHASRLIIFDSKRSHDFHQFPE